MKYDDQPDKIHQRQLWIVRETILSTGEGMAEKGRRSVLEVGEIFEIRYPYGWHVRSERNEYFHLDPKDILAKATLVGEIYDNVAFENTANLEEILRLRLYRGSKNSARRVPLNKEDRAEYLESLNK